MAPSEPVHRTYGNWRKPTSPGIGSLGMVGTGLLLGGLCLTVLMFMRSTTSGATVAVITGATVTPFAIQDRFGRNFGQHAIAFVGYRLGRASGSHIYRGGPLGVTGAGQFQLPGLAAASTMLEAQDSYGRPFGMICYPSVGHYAVVISCAADGDSLKDESDIDTNVAYWGQWLASLSTEPGLIAASVTVETAPDPGTRLAAEVFGSMSAQAPPLARHVLTQITQTYPSGSAAVSTRIALTFTGAAGPGTGRRTPEQVARGIGMRLPGLTANLAMTGAGAASPMTATQIAEAVRVAYDPSIAAVIEAAAQAGGSGITWESAGPAAAQSNWEEMVHDGGVSRTWIMGAAPGGVVISSVLAGLLGPHEDVARKRVSLLYRPHTPAQAGRLVEHDLRDAKFKIAGSKTAARDSVDVAAAARTSMEEATGAGLMRFGMVVTATVLDPADLPKASAAIDALSAPARVALRVARGSQDSAFAAGLPIGLVLPDHLRVPQAIRDAV